MILIVTEYPNEFGEGGGRRLVPVLQLDNALELEHCTLIRTAGGEVFEVEERFDDIVERVAVLLTAQVELDEDDDDEPN